ncbi:hypothetical protein G7Y89_g11320 [Cudoniella acicularis]|uniref:protein-tyrosine-phosphatase n=1 Tax=Cudoniella acicularis TaxID=354080 RepID=A0A8H4W0R4_9HELO|nr:hypothetical protein G7Y89_g11320 [Cudoniella acicularis]
MPPSNPLLRHEIIPDLYLSRFPDEMPPEITHILNLSPYAHPPASIANLKSLHISTLADIDDITPHIPAILEFIEAALSPAPDAKSSNSMDGNTLTEEEVEKKEEKRNKLLVHCAIGINRSPSAVIAYLCSVHKINSARALKIVKHKKPDIRPSKLFLAQIDRFFRREGEAGQDPMVGFHERLKRRKAGNGGKGKK